MSRVFLVLCGVLYLAYGVWVLLYPESGLAHLRLVPGNGDLVSDLSGSHGGLNTALGLFLIYAAGTGPWHRPALLLVALMNGGYLGGRAVHALMTGLPSGLVLAVMVMELVLLALALWFARPDGRRATRPASRGLRQRGAHF